MAATDMDACFDDMDWSEVDDDDDDDDDEQDAINSTAAAALDDLLQQTEPSSSSSSSSDDDDDDSYASSSSSSNSNNYKLVVVKEAPLLRLENVTAQTRSKIPEKKKPTGSGWGWFGFNKKKEEEDLKKAVVEKESEKESEKPAEVEEQPFVEEEEVPDEDSQAISVNDDDESDSNIILPKNQTTIISHTESQLSQIDQASLIVRSTAASVVTSNSNSSQTSVAVSYISKPQLESYQETVSSSSSHEQDDTTLTASHHQEEQSSVVTESSQQSVSQQSQYTKESVRSEQSSKQSKSEQSSSSQRSQAESTRKSQASESSTRSRRSRPDDSRSVSSGDTCTSNHDDEVIQEMKPTKSTTSKPVAKTAPTVPQASPPPPSSKPTPTVPPPPPKIEPPEAKQPTPSAPKPSKASQVVPPVPNCKATEKAKESTKPTGTTTTKTVAPPVASSTTKPLDTPVTTEPVKPQTPKVKLAKSSLETPAFKLVQPETTKPDKKKKKKKKKKGLDTHFGKVRKVSRHGDEVSVGTTTFQKNATTATPLLVKDTVEQRPWGDVLQPKKKNSSPQRRVSMENKDVLKELETLQKSLHMFGGGAASMRNMNSSHLEGIQEEENDDDDAVVEEEEQEESESQTPEPEPVAEDANKPEDTLVELMNLAQLESALVEDEEECFDFDRMWDNVSVDASVAASYARRQRAKKPTKKKTVTIKDKNDSPKKVKGRLRVFEKKKRSVKHKKGRMYKLSSDFLSTVHSLFEAEEDEYGNRIEEEEEVADESGDEDTKPSSPSATIRGALSKLGSERSLFITGNDDDKSRVSRVSRALSRISRARDDDDWEDQDMASAAGSQQTTQSTLSRTSKISQDPTEVFEAEMKRVQAGKIMSVTQLREEMNNLRGTSVNLIHKDYVTYREKTIQARASDGLVHTTVDGQLQFGIQADSPIRPTILEDSGMVTPTQKPNESRWGTPKGNTTGLDDLLTIRQSAKGVKDADLASHAADQLPQAPNIGGGGYERRQASTMGAFAAIASQTTGLSGPKTGMNNQKTGASIQNAIASVRESFGRSPKPTHSPTGPGGLLSTKTADSIMLSVKSARKTIKKLKKEADLIQELPQAPAFPSMQPSAPQDDFAFDANFGDNMLLSTITEDAEDDAEAKLVTGSSDDYFGGGGDDDGHDVMPKRKNRFRGGIKLKMPSMPKFNSRGGYGGGQLLD